MRYLFSIYLFLISNILWSEKLYLHCDTSHIFFPDYEKRIYFKFNENGKTGAEETYIYKYDKPQNEFLGFPIQIYIEPLQISASNWVLDRETGKMKHYDKSEPDRTCKATDYRGNEKEGRKDYKWRTKQEKKKKI